MMYYTYLFPSIFCDMCLVHNINLLINNIFFTVGHVAIAVNDNYCILISILLYSIYYFYCTYFIIIGHRIHKHFKSKQSILLFYD